MRIDQICLLIALGNEKSLYKDLCVTKGRKGGLFERGANIALKKLLFLDLEKEGVRKIGKRVNLLILLKIGLN